MTGYAYNAGSAFTDIRRGRVGHTRAEFTSDGKRLIYSKPARRLVRSISKRLHKRNTNIDRQLLELWAKRAWEEL